jgi:release factor glutamine methyltransferase
VIGATVEHSVSRVSRDARRAIGGESPALDARRLLGHVLGRDTAWLLAHDDERVCERDRRRFEALVARRAGGEPVSYIVGSAWFYGRAFAVTVDVLVPRPETELLVEAALDDIRSRRAQAARPLRVCDVGTGCGAIALTLAAEEPALEVVASDVSAAALEVAARNATSLGVAGRVRFVLGDLAAPLLGLAPFDCLVANLPYVPSGAVPERPDPVGFEPRLAIDGGKDGLALYRRLIDRLPLMLGPAAVAMLEAAPGTVGPLAALAQRSLPRSHIEIGEDYAGLERWVSITVS